MVQMAVSPLPQWFEGSEYTHKVAACIMKYGPISRITLAQILGLSQGAVSRITSDLIYAGVIEETPMPSGKAGKLPKGFVQKENTLECQSVQVKYDFSQKWIKQYLGMQHLSIAFIPDINNQTRTWYCISVFP